MPPASPLALRSRPAARVQPQAGARRHPSQEPMALRRAQPPYGGSRAHSRRGVSASREQWGRRGAGNNAVCFSYPLLETNTLHAKMAAALDSLPFLR
jgi:hypothetical protein